MATEEEIYDSIDAGLSRTGGAAFPLTRRSPSDHDGMSLRDWFAGQALAESTREIWASHKYDDVAKRAYAIADAMIAARRAGAQ